MIEVRKVEGYKVLLELRTTGRCCSTTNKTADLNTVASVSRRLNTRSAGS
jgi:hypothetical protein